MPYTKNFYDHLTASKDEAHISLLVKTQIAGGTDAKYMQVTTEGLGCVPRSPEENSWYHPHARFEIDAPGYEASMADLVVKRAVPMNANKETTVQQDIGWSVGLAVGTSGIDVSAALEGSHGQTMQVENFEVINRSIPGRLVWDWQLADGNLDTPLAIGVLPMHTDTVWILDKDFDGKITLNFGASQVLARPGRTPWTQMAAPITRTVDFSEIMLSPPSTKPGGR